MKVKQDFVTNSSSTSYILSFTPDEYKEFQKLIDIFVHGVNEFKKPDESFIISNFTEDPDVIEDVRYERDELEKIIVICDVSDELGHGFIECTKFNSNIIWPE